MASTQVADHGEARSDAYIVQAPALGCHSARGKRREQETLRTGYQQNMREGRQMSLTVVLYDVIESRVCPYERRLEEDMGMRFVLKIQGRAICLVLVIQYKPLAVDRY